MKIDAIPDDVPSAARSEAVERIFDAVGRDRARAAAETVAYLTTGGSPLSVFETASRMIFRKGTDSHDYKYGAAIWEESMNVTNPKWGPDSPPPPCTTSPARKRPTALS